MTFSKLATRTVPTSKYSSRYGAAVSRLIIHHTAGGTNEGNVSLLSSNPRDVSASYCLLTDGSLVGIVPEEFRPWTSGGPAADNPSVTVETVNTGGDPGWPIADAQLEKLAQLAADLCQRYGWGKLDRSRVIGHRQVAQTACPGPFLYPRLEWIVERANQIISGGDPADTTPKDTEMAVIIETDAGDTLVVDHNQMTYWNIHEGIPAKDVPKREAWLLAQGMTKLQGKQPAAFLRGYMWAHAGSGPQADTTAIAQRVAADVLKGLGEGVKIDAAALARETAKAVNDDAAKRMQG